MRCCICPPKASSSIISLEGIKCLAQAGTARSFPAIKRAGTLDSAALLMVDWSAEARLAQAAAGRVAGPQAEADEEGAEPGEVQPALIPGFIFHWTCVRQKPLESARCCKARHAIKH